LLPFNVGSHAEFGPGPDVDGIYIAANVGRSLETGPLPTLTALP